MLVGEFKFPGGSKDATDSSLVHTALRELNEEFLGLNVDSRNFVVHLFNQKRTKVIQSRSYLMHNFVAFSAENEWLRKIDVDVINSHLLAKRQRFEKALSDNSFWDLESKVKEDYAPEVKESTWVELFHETVG